MTLPERLAAIEERLRAATPEALKAKAAALAEVWIVKAIDKISEELNKPDDIPGIFEIAFTDGYLTGNLHSSADLAFLSAALKVAMLGLKHYAQLSNVEYRGDWSAPGAVARARLTEIERLAQAKGEG